MDAGTRSEQLVAGACLRGILPDQIAEVVNAHRFEATDHEVERLDPRGGPVRLTEVKGRGSGAETITVTRNEILYSLNKPDDFILAIVEFMPDGSERTHDLRQPFQREPDFGVTSVHYDFAGLIARAGPPA